MLDILIYRLFRLRRTIVLGMVPSLATLCAITLYTGATDPILLILAIFLPMAHAVSYPNNWTETLAVSLALAVCLALASTMTPGIALDALLLRIAALVFLFFVLFFVLVGPLATLPTLGERTESTVRASLQTHMPADKIRETLTYYPGRNDRKVICGEADADGRFPVTMRLMFDVLTFEEDKIDDKAEEKEDFAISLDGVMECHGHAVINSTGPDHHEVFFFDDEAGSVTVSKYTFEETGAGTRVVLEEAGTPLTQGERFGMWVSDYLADYLTDCIDDAAGRPARANRAFAHSLFVVDLANILVPWLNAQCMDEPTDHRS